MRVKVEHASYRSRRARRTETSNLDVRGVYRVFSLLLISLSSVPVSSTLSRPSPTINSRASLSCVCVEEKRTILPACRAVPYARCVSIFFLILPFVSNVNYHRRTSSAALFLSSLFQHLYILFSFHFWYCNSAYSFRSYFSYLSSALM